MVYVLLVSLLVLCYPLLQYVLFSTCFHSVSFLITMASKTHKRTSPIKVYAKKDANGELIMPPSCNLRSTSYTGKSNASNFQRHVELMHHEGYQHLNRGFTSKDQKEMNIEIMKMIVADLRPLSLLDSTRYKRTYDICCPAAKVLCKKDVPKIDVESNERW